MKAGKCGERKSGEDAALPADPSPLPAGDGGALSVCFFLRHRVAGGKCYSLFRG